MAKIHIGSADYSGGSAGWVDCWYHVNISGVKDADLDVSGGIRIEVETQSKKINGIGRLALGVTEISRFVSNHPDFIGGDSVQFDLQADFNAAVASLDNAQNSAALRQEFADNAAILTAAGTITVVTPSEEWSISDAGRIHTLTAIDTDIDIVNDTIRVVAETDQAETVLFLSQDLAEVFVQVRATNGESPATLRTRLAALYDAIELRVQREYTSRFQYYGEELNPS